VTRCVTVTGPHMHGHRMTADWPEIIPARYDWSHTDAYKIRNSAATIYVCFRKISAYW